MADSYIVVGAGVFGSSTALELAKAGHAVTVLERSLDGYHSVDAASNDLNKIIRADYADEHYRDLARRAISTWRRSPLLSSLYHEVGVFFYNGHDDGDLSSSQAFVSEGVHRAAPRPGSTSTLELPRRGGRLPQMAHAITSHSDLCRSFPPGMQTKIDHWVQQNKEGSLRAYVNPRGGWGEADRATRLVLDEAKRHGAQVNGSSHVVKLLFDSDSTPSRVVGVRTSGGEEHYTRGEGHVILCAGAWAGGLLEDLLPAHLQPHRLPTWPSAQCVVTLQLDESQRRAYAGMPVVFHYQTGFYCFEPDSEGVMKIAIHGNGYQHPLPPRSPTPPVAYPSFLSGQKGSSKAESAPEPLQPASRSQGYIPPDMLASMLSQLTTIYPDLASAPVKDTRVCFYSDSKDENWIIDYIPGLQGLVLASGDSGHAFKFLPILGSLVCARLGLPSVASLTPHQRTVFSFEHHRRLLDEAGAPASLAPARLRSRL